MPRGEDKALPLQLVICDSNSFLGTGMTLKFDIGDEAVKAFFHGKKVGDEIEGQPIGFAGYRFRITGASDIAGFPHIRGIPGTGLKQVLKSGPPGYRPRKYKIPKKGGGYRIINLKGVRRKKTVRGEELSEWTRQVNMAIIGRSGKDIRGMTEAEVANDRILVGIAEKLGKTLLKWGLMAVKVGDQTLEEKFKEAGGEELLQKMYFKVGLRLIQGLDKDELKAFIEPLKKVSRKKPKRAGRWIAAVVLDAYKKVAQGGEEPDKLADEVADRILEIAKKQVKGELEKPPKVEFKIAEGGGEGE